ncbi:MAG: hypothetical protein M5U20_08170 [Phycisphaerales bacterium]|nr:hypothetical protein [Phycisphaerales bacterium]
MNDAAVPASDLSTDALRTMVRKMGLERQARTPVEKLSRYQLLNVLVTHGFERLSSGAGRDAGRRRVGSDGVDQARS